MFKVTFIDRITGVCCTHNRCTLVTLSAEALSRYYLVFTEGQEQPCKVDTHMWEVQSVQLQE